MHFKLFYLEFIILFIGKTACESDDYNSAYNEDYYDCLSYYKLDHEQDKSCELLAIKFELSMYTFQAINSNLNCNDTIDNYEYVCSSGQRPKCLKTYEVKINDTLESILGQYFIKPNDFYSANPLVNIDSIQVSQVVCLVKIKPEFLINITDQSIIALSKRVHDVDSGVLKAFRDFMNNPTKVNAYLYQQQTVSLVKEKKEVRTILKNFEKSCNGKRVMIEQGFDKMCSKIDPNLYPKASKCACENIEPKSFCTMVFNEEYTEVTKRKKRNSQQNYSLNKRKISKRQNCKGIIPSPDELKEIFSLKNVILGKAELCFGISCWFYETLNIIGQLCYKSEPYTFKNLRIEYKGQEAIDFLLKTAEKVANEIVYSAIGQLNGISFQIKINLCIPVVSQILEKLRLDSIWDGCLLKISATYHFFRGTIYAKVEISLFFFKASGDILLQIYTTTPKCIGSCSNRFDARDWCYNPAGYYNGNVKLQVGINLFFFSIWKTVYEKNFKKSEPKCLLEDYYPSFRYLLGKI